MKNMERLPQTLAVYPTHSFSEAPELPSDNLFLPQDLFPDPYQRHNLETNSQSRQTSFLDLTDFSTDAKE